MILSRYNRLVIDELPNNIASAIEFFNKNYISLKNEKKISYPNDNLEYHIIRNFLEDDIIYWQSHRQYIYCYIILSGQEIIEVNDIADLEQLQDYHSKSDTILYRGMSQSRIRLKEDNIIIINPEDAYRFHYIPKFPCVKLLIKIPFIISS